MPGLHADAPVPTAGALCPFLSFSPLPLKNPVSAEARRYTYHVPDLMEIKPEM